MLLTHLIVLQEQLDLVISLVKLLADAKAHKFLTYIQDPDHTGEDQVMFVSVLHDAVGNGYLNQYARVETELDLGSFDYAQTEQMAPYSSIQLSTK